MLITFILLLILKQIQCQITYDIGDDNAHGIRISGNDQFAIYAINRYGGFVIIYAPFTPMQRCGYFNLNKNLFVYSVAAIFNNDNATSNQLYTFVQIAEDISSKNVYIGIITLNRSLCGMFYLTIKFEFVIYSEFNCLFSKSISYKREHTLHSNMVWYTSRVYVIKSNSISKICICIC